MTRRVHSELIKAWADGAEIQVLAQEGWTNTDFPNWSPDREYRIKPAPIEIVEELGYTKEFGMGFNFENWAGPGAKVKFTIDPTSFDVIAVELVK